jgi:transcriptional regulator with XRE-family HTH domain
MARGRTQESAKTGEHFALAEWLNKNLRNLTDKTNDEIATGLGYTQPNIISMWVTGRTKVPLERLPALAEIMNVDLTFLLPLWFEQYVGKKAYVDILRAVQRSVSEDEEAMIASMRRITKGKKVKITATQEKKIAEILGL